MPIPHCEKYHDKNIYKDPGKHDCGNNYTCVKFTINLWRKKFNELRSQSQLNSSSCLREQHVLLGKKEKKKNISPPIQDRFTA